MQSSWADDSQEDNTPTPISGALKHLVNNGLRFKRAPFWSSSARPKLEKSLSFYFSVDTVVTSQEILEAFDKARIEIDDIPSIQTETSNRTWVVSFDSQLAKEPLEKLRQGTTVFMGDCENRLVLFKIYEAPAELPDTAFIGQRSYYGRVSSFRRDKIAQFIDGVRTAWMSLNRHISSINNLTGKFIRVWYPNQPKTCRNCDSEDHLVKDCSSVRCLNCEQSGYRSENCKESPKCTVCRAEDHQLGDCPFALLSANVDSEGRANQGRKI